MFQVFTTFIYGLSMNWVTRYHPVMFKTMDDALEHISGYEVDKCRIQYLSNSRNKKDIVIFSKMNQEKHGVLGYETNNSIVIILEL
jgi:hypothetical protein